MGLLPLSVLQKFNISVSHRFGPLMMARASPPAWATPCGVRLPLEAFGSPFMPVWSPATSYMLQTSSIRAASAGVTGLYGSWVCQRGRCIAGWSRVKP